MKNSKIQNKQANKTPKQLITSFRGAWAADKSSNSPFLTPISYGYWHEGTFLSEPQPASRTTQDDRYMKLPSQTL